MAPVWWAWHLWVSLKWCAARCHLTPMLCRQWLASVASDPQVTCNWTYNSVLLIGTFLDTRCFLWYRLFRIYYLSFRLFSLACSWASSQQIVQHGQYNKLFFKRAISGKNNNPNETMINTDEIDMGRCKVYMDGVSRGGIKSEVSASVTSLYILLLTPSPVYSRIHVQLRRRLLQRPDCASNCILWQYKEVILSRQVMVKDWYTYLDNEMLLFDGQPLTLPHTAPSFCYSEPAVL